jgi:aspartate/methionine/tyrosine aminotransferase
MRYKRMPIEIESPEEIKIDHIESNLAESSVADLHFPDLKLDLSRIRFGYPDHRGNHKLRHLLATDAGPFDPGQVLLTQGAAGAIFIVNTVLLTPTDHLIVLRPNYAPSIEVPRAIGCSVTYIDLDMDQNWKPNIQEVKKQIRPNTRLISVTSPHNPTGMVLEEQELQALVELAQTQKIFLLVDETYRDICFKALYPTAASKSSWVISISSVSKAFGLPGLRIGWLITKDSTLMEKFLAAKEMIHITNSVIDEEIVLQVLLEKEKWANQINEKARQNFEILKDWLESEKRLQCVLPRGGVICFARMIPNAVCDQSRFYQWLTDQYKTVVGPGHWFEMPDRYMRIGFGWPSSSDLKKGLTNISLAMSDC